MGQGNYTAIVYGVIAHDRSVLDLELINEWSLRGTPLKLETAYECNDPWIGFMVADNNGNINTGYSPHSTTGDYYPQKGLLFYSRALPLLKLPELIKSADPEHWQLVQASWERFYSDAKKSGLEVGEPSLLLVDDFS